jgi:membrane protein implicated in regulation of membrane protease activity
MSDLSAINHLELMLFDTPGFFWVVVAFVLLGVEMLLTGGFFLSFALSAFVVALSTVVVTAEQGFLWRLVAFAVIGVVLIYPLRNALRKHAAKVKDINEY